MNCSKFEDIASDLVRAQMMDADVRRDALAHTSECSACLQRFQDQDSLSRGLDLFREATQSEKASPAVEARLIEAFRNREVVHPIVPARSNSRFWLAAVAAILLIGFGVVTLRFRAEKNASTAPEVARANQGGEGTIQTRDVPNKSASPTETISDVRKVHKLSRSKPNRLPRLNNAGVDRNSNTAVANHVVNEVATEFVPVGYLNAANLQDGGQIVRVELPRSALANFGFPVNMERFNEKVKADVLVGVDGMAHAIRFVQ